MGPLQLAREEVHCWCVALDVSAGTVAGLHATLSPDERQRSARRRFARDQRRFIVARGVLRALLGHYLGTDPGRVRFGYNAFGKPALSPADDAWLKFNLSHAGDLALIAVAADADLGVDVEQVRDLHDLAEVARQVLSPAEADYLDRLPGHRRARAFFSCWTKQEACVKARGNGLDSAAAELPVGWSLYTLRPAPGYVGALVVKGSGWRVQHRRWQPERAEQARQESNLQPPVLETGALPIELRTFEGG
jgi:4'-phosphopantetheinyl transferase